MANRRNKPEEIVSEPRQVDVHRGQGMTMASAIRQIGVTQLARYRLRKTYGGLGTYQVKELKRLEKEERNRGRVYILVAWAVCFPISFSLAFQTIWR
ncbi:MAG: hypothetical protein ACU843_09450 [Gammaproteobacteria bacterium]